MNEIKEAGRQLAPGCCSASVPCNHQKQSPYTLCDTCSRVQKVEREFAPKLCDSCGKNFSDPPSRLCPGCQAYQEHQR